MDNLICESHELKLNQSKQKKHLFVSRKQNSSNLSNCHTFADSSENETDCCPPEVLSLESDFSSNNGTVDSSDQLEMLNDETFTENINTSQFHNQEISVRKSNKSKEPLDNDFQYGTPPITKQYYDKWQNEHMFKHRVSYAVVEDKNEKFLDTTSRRSRNDNCSNMGHKQSKEKAILQKKITFDDSVLKYAELTHQKLKTTLSDIQEQSAINNDEQLPLTNPSMNYANHEALLGNEIDFQHNNNLKVLFDDQAFKKQERLHSNGFSVSSFPSYNYKGSPQSSNPTKFNTILQIKDDMLQEKESSIMKLKLQIASLQHQLQESETALHQFQSGNSTTERFSSAFSTCDSGPKSRERKLFELEQLLGKTECKLLDITTKYENKKKESLKNKELLALTVKNKDQAYLDIKKKYKSALERLERYRHRVQSLEQYLGDLPTMEENNQVKDEAKMLGQERKTLVVEIAELKTSLEEKIKMIKSYEKKAKFLEDDHDKKLCVIEDLNNKLVESKKSKEALGHSERDELQGLRMELSRLQKSKENVTMTISACEKRIKLMQEKHEKEITALTSKVREAEELARNSRRDIFMKQQASKKINSAVKTLSLQNQQLLDENLNLLEKVKNQGKLHDNFTEVSRIFTKIQNEASSAVKDLTAVAQVLIQTADGADPNISALLGVRSDTSVLEEEANDPEPEGSNCIDNSFTIDKAKKRLLELRSLRNDVDQLRTSLSNRYADAIGDNCVTQ